MIKKLLSFIQKEWKEWHKQKRVSQKKQQKELEEKFNELQFSQATDRVKAIKIIKHQEENRYSHRKIAQALGRGYKQRVDESRDPS